VVELVEGFVRLKTGQKLVRPQRTRELPRVRTEAIYSASPNYLCKAPV
jgi:hypothetical protein